ncbi:MAG: hypothetical protein AABZ15_09660 [Nitrospirota bacterium]
MLICRYALSAALLLALSLLQGCALGKQLQADTADPKTIRGTYDLLLYGCRYPSDYEHAAFLISSDAKYPVSLFVSDTSYKVKKRLPAELALSEAYAFVRCGIHTIEETRVQRIADDGGGTIGYEVLPRYLTLDFLGTDPLLVNYSLKDGKVTVYIQLSPFIERKLNLQNVSGSSGGN